MRVLIWADIEGVSGIDDPDNGFKDEKYKHLITAEANAVIRGLKRGGVKEIDIFDGHGMGDNFVKEDLDKTAKYLGGGWMVTLAELIRSEKLRSYDALVLIGQHAQTGAVNGFIAHTNSSLTALRLNGKPVGEIEQAVWLAGYFDVPTILVSGDEIAIREANSYFPDIATVSTKRKEDDKFVCLPIESIYKQLEEKSFDQISQLRSIQPYVLPGPIAVEILYAFTELVDAMTILPNYQKKDDRTVVYEAEDCLEAFWAYHGFRVVVNNWMTELCQKALREVVKEFKLESRERFQAIRRKTLQLIEKNRKEFPEIEF